MLVKEKEKQLFGFLPEKKFEALQTKLKVHVKTLSQQHQMDLFYTQNGVDIKETPDGRKFQIEYIGMEGEYKILKSL